MSLSDPLGDMLTRIRNAQIRKKDYVHMPASRFRANVLEVLEREGFIRGFKKVELENHKKNFEIELKYINGEPVIKEISRISTIGYGLLGEEEMIMFPLDNITESRYYMNIDEEEIDNDEDILPTCEQIVRVNKDLDRQSSFAIWKNADSDNNYYVKHYTHYIQEDKWT